LRRNEHRKDGMKRRNKLRKKLTEHYCAERTKDYQKEPKKKEAKEN
jgi:hypothetical protein